MNVKAIAKPPMDERSQLFSKWTTEFVRKHPDMFELFCSRAKRAYFTARDSRIENLPCVWFNMGLSYILAWEYGYDIPSRILAGAQSDFYSFNYSIHSQNEGKATSWADEANSKYPVTVKGLIAEIEKVLTEAQKEAVDEYDHDPEDYLRYHRSNPHEEHPWGEDCVALIRAWCQADEFEWFMVHRNVKEATESAISENLWEMTMWEDDSTAAPIAQAAREALASQMGKFIEGVKESSNG